MEKHNLIKLIKESELINEMINRDKALLLMGMSTEFCIGEYDDSRYEGVDDMVYKQGINADIFLKLPYPVTMLSYRDMCFKDNGGIIDICGLVIDSKLSLEQTDEYPLSGLFFLRNSSLTEHYTMLPCTLAFGKGRNFQVLFFDGMIEKFNKIFNMSMGPQDYYQTTKGFAAMLRYFQLLLSCKNIQRKEIVPSEKVNVKRLKNGKEPYNSYYVLDILGNINSQKYNGHSGISQRLHFCRGHFKNYTSEKPLLGKHVGLYWWPSLMRGNKDKGEIQKDYDMSNTLSQEV